ncbi:response regulator [Oceanobacillus sp. Castelsardo]|uniref:response regulator n=1 Tax=Oceanobacillus sp. Castelsardo TaxID=1851204 RepID=UPI0009EF4F5E|nr:response regulator [Oceanobacillus sp. Castelsardo]
MVKVLITDDAAFMRMQLKNMITELGHEVIGEAENGLDAVEKAKQLNPDLITMDITMPEMNGVDAVKQIKSDNPNVKIIMCSAMGQQTMVVDAIKAGANDFIVKPFQKERIQEALEKIL